MAGIVATSVSTNNAADTDLDKSITGFLSGEQISLSVTPAPSSYLWRFTSPQGSSRAVLTGDAIASPKFTPDVAGYYLASVTVNSSTVYVLRVQVVSAGAAETVDGLRVLEITDAQAIAPATGVSIYYSTTQGSLAFKRANGDIETINTTAV